MRKLNRGRKFSRKKDQRRALFRSLAREFFLREKIKTSETKAKGLMIFAEKMITRAKVDSLNTKRLLLKDFSPKISQKLIKEIAPRYKERKGGCVRITKLGNRQSDGAKMAIIELVK